MKLLLIRHAIAKERDSGRWADDSLRPLTARGIAKFQAGARMLAARGIEPDLLLSSRYIRAWQTAEILNAEADWPDPVAMPQLEFESSADIIDAVNAITPRRSTIALVGHEPTLGELASTLLGGDDDAIAIDVKKGSAMCLACGDVARPAEATLRWYLTPKLVDTGDAR